MNSEAAKCYGVSVLSVLLSLNKNSIVCVVACMQMMFVLCPLTTFPYFLQEFLLKLVTGGQLLGNCSLPIKGSEKEEEKGA